jgi:hypothetical protein
MAKRPTPIARLTRTAERGFAALADVIAKLHTKVDAAEAKLHRKVDSAEFSLAGKLNRLETKLTKFEESEVDKRKQFEVRVAAIEKHLALAKKIAA